jgi:hypothetical protein
MPIPAIIAAAVARVGVPAAIKKYGKQAVQAVVNAEKKVSGKIGSKKPLEAAKAKAKPTDKRVKDVRGKSKSATTRKANANRKANDASMSAARKENVSSGRRRAAAGLGYAATGAAVVGAGMSSGKAKPKRAKVTGRGGKLTADGKANVTREQLQASGLSSLTKYMNQWNKSGKRPTAAAKKPAAKSPAAKKPAAKKPAAKKPKTPQMLIKQRQAPKKKRKFSLGFGRK